MVPYARLGGEDGMRLTRAAFAVMIRFSGDGLDKFSEMVDEVENQWVELENDEEREFKIKDYIKTSKSYEQLQKRWESASKMRQWVQEKKKNLIEKIKKKVEEDYVKNRPTADSKPAAPESDTMQIDTTTTAATIDKQGGGGGGLTEDDK